MRAEGVDRRSPANDGRLARADRGYVEQPEERVEPPKKAGFMLPNNQLRRRIEVSPSPSTPTVCVRPEPDGDYEPPGGDDELEELRAVGRQLEAREQERPVIVTRGEEKPEQSLVRLVRPPPSAAPPPSKPADVRETAMARVRAGEDHAQVAADMGLRRDTLYRWLSDGKDFVRAYYRKEDQRAVAIRVVDGGESQHAVAEEMGTSQASVSRWAAQLRTERELKAMAEEKKEKTHTYHPPKTKLAVVRRLRQLEADEGQIRGQRARVAREMGIPEALVASWVSSGEWEPDPPVVARTETLMSTPSAPPPSAPAPVTTVQPTAAPAMIDPLMAQMLRAMLVPQAPPAPPAPAVVAAPPPPSQPAPAMMGLEEYIRGVVRMEVDAAVAKHLPAALKRMIGGQ